VSHHDFDPTELLDALRKRPDLDLARQRIGSLYHALFGVGATDVRPARPSKPAVASQQHDIMSNPSLS